MHTPEIYNDSSELEQFKSYIKEIRKSFDTSISWLKLSMSEKKNAIIQKCSNVKEDFKEATQVNIEYVSQMVDVILATDPVKKFQEITENLSENMKRIFKEVLENIYQKVIKEQIGKQEAIQVIEKLKNTLTSIFFNADHRKNAFHELLKKEKISFQEINDFLTDTKNKVIPTEEWQKIIETGILNWSLWVTESKDIEDRIEILSTLSYYSLQWCLRVWIDTWLFIQNVVKFFPQKAKELDEFKTNSKLSWWIALTELSSGSDLLTNLETTYVENSDGTFTIEGRKHLQWLTKEATHWILLARDKKWKSIKLFYLDTRKLWIDVTVSEEYKMSWLKSITYWINEIKATVSSDCVFEPLEDDKKSILRSFGSSLFDSRIQFPAMASWYLERLYDESYYKANLRSIAWWKMIENECVKEKLWYIKWYHEIISEINRYLIIKKISLQENNKDKKALSIICKTLSTEYMVTSWAKARDLQWWDWFKQDNIVRSLAEDAWPFSRFEGVNEMLYSHLAHEYRRKNITEGVSAKTLDYLSDCKELKKSLEETSLTQENIWKIYSRVLLINMLFEIESKQKNAFTILKEEIKQILILAQREKFELE